MQRRAALTIFTLLICLGLDQPVQGQDELPLLRLIKPQAGESGWAKVPWRTRLDEARQESAQSDKPLFLWRSGGGIALGRA